MKQWNLAVAQPAGEGGGGTGVTCPHCMSGSHRAGIFTCFPQNFTKNILSYLQNEVPEIRGENWNWGPCEVRGALRRNFSVFSAKFTKNIFIYICEIKWPKSEEKLKLVVVVGGPWKVRGPPEGVPLLEMSGCTTGIWSSFPALFCAKPLDQSSLLPFPGVCQP